MRGQGRAQGIAHHREEQGRCWGGREQLLRHYRESLRAIKIIRIDDREGLHDQVTGRTYGMRRSPRLRPLLRNVESRRQILHFLKGIIDADLVRVASAHAFVKGGCHILPNNEHYSRKTR